MKKNSADKLEVKGSMSEAGADKAGLIQAISSLVGVILFGVVAVILAIGLAQ